MKVGGGLQAVELSSRTQVQLDEPIEVGDRMRI